MDLPDLSLGSPLSEYLDTEPVEMPILQMEVERRPVFPRTSKRPPRSFMEDLVGSINRDKFLSDEEFLEKIKQKRKRADPNHMSKRAMKKWDAIQKECNEMKEATLKIDKIFQKGNSLTEVIHAVKQSAKFFLRRQEIEKFVKNSPKSRPKRDTLVLLLQQESCDWERHIRKVMEMMDQEKETGTVKPEYAAEIKKASEKDLKARENDVTNFLRAFHCAYVEMAQKNDVGNGKEPHQ